MPSEREEFAQLAGCSTDRTWLADLLTLRLKEEPGNPLARPILTDAQWQTVIAALRAQDREDGAREMREPQPKAVVFRQLSDEERRSRAEALAQAYRDERAAVWPAGCLKPNSCARHRGCMYAQSSRQCRHYGLDLTEAVVRAEAALSTRTEDGDA